MEPETNTDPAPAYESQPEYKIEALARAAKDFRRAAKDPCGPMAPADSPRILSLAAEACATAAIRLAERIK